MTKSDTAYFALLRRFWRQADGVTAIEFAFLAIPFFGLIAAILQTSLVFIAGQVLESAVIDGARMIRTGQAQSSPVTNFRKYICDGVYGLYGDCSGMHLRVDTITNFGATLATIPTDPTCTADCDWSVPQTWQPGIGGEVILVQAYFRYPVPIPLGPFGIANMADGSRLIGATYVFKNEPF